MRNTKKETERVNKEIIKGNKTRCQIRIVKRIIAEFKNHERSQARMSIKLDAF